MVKSVKSRSSNKPRSSSSSGKTRKPKEPSYLQSVLSSLRSYGSGFFTMEEISGAVTQSRKDIGLEPKRPSLGKTCTKEAVLRLKLDGKLKSQLSAADGPVKFKATGELAAAAKEAKKLFPNDAHPTPVGKHMMRRIGGLRRLPSLCLNELEQQAIFTSTDVSDVSMDTEYTHHHASPFEGQSQEEQSTPPGTPQRTRSSLTPSDMTSPALSRCSTRSTLLHHNRDTSHDVANAMGVDSSHVPAPSGAHPQASSGDGHASIEALANDAMHLIEKIRRRAAEGNDAPMQEKDALLQQLRAQLQEKDVALLQKDDALLQMDAELQYISADLNAGRAQWDMLLQLAGPGPYM